MKQKIINRNEVYQGPAPKVLKVIKSFNIQHINFYLDGYYNSVLIPKISKKYSIAEDQIIVSYGEEDFLRFVFNKLDAKKDSVLTHEFHYSYYNKYLSYIGARLVTFRMFERNDEFVFDIDDCIKEYNKNKPKVLLLTTPNNPTGNALSRIDLTKILQNVSPGTLVVVDEAYYGFESNYERKSLVRLLDKFPNLVILRSFSKRFALAGLRISFALCGTKVKSMLRYQNRYLGVSRILEEVAIAALDSGDYYKRISKQVINDRESFIKNACHFKGIKAYNSKANFVLLRIPDHAIVKKIKLALQSEKIVIGKFIKDDLLRVTIGYSKHTKRFIKVIKEFAAKRT